MDDHSLARSASADPLEPVGEGWQPPDGETVGASAVIGRKRGRNGPAWGGMDAVKGGLNSPEMRLNSAEMHLDSAEMHLDSAEMHLDSAEINLNSPDMHLNSPEVWLNVGDWHINSVKL